MADDPPALEQHHCDVGANFVRIDRPDACAGSVIAYCKNRFKPRITQGGSAATEDKD
jgi:hypothetical protein